jgi:hypothetical protein
LPVQMRGEKKLGRRLKSRLIQLNAIKPNQPISFFFYHANIYVLFYFILYFLDETAGESKVERCTPGNNFLSVVHCTFSSHI